MTHQPRLFALLTSSLALAGLLSWNAHASTMTADVNCRAWGARYDAPALLDRMLSTKPAQNRDLAHRVCEKKVRPETMHILGRVPTSSTPHALHARTEDASYTVTSR